jgi:hypothetical protein
LTEKEIEIQLALGTLDTSKLSREEHGHYDAIMLCRIFNMTSIEMFNRQLLNTMPHTRNGHNVLGHQDLIDPRA